MPWAAKPIPFPIPKEVEERFWPKVNIKGAKECWPWVGQLTRGGYGRIKVGNRLVYATRVSLAISGVRVPTDKQACHHCDNPVCVNPEHLFLGTPDDNVQDCVRKGRQARLMGRHRGEGNPSAQLNEDQVKEILKMKGSVTPKRIAQKYGISRWAIYQILSGRKWSHLQDQSQ